MTVAKILYVATHGSNDPARATIPFDLAKGALAAGHEPQIALLHDAVYLLKDKIRDEIHGFGWSPLAKIFPVIIEHSVPIYV